MGIWICVIYFIFPYSPDTYFPKEHIQLKRAFKKKSENHLVAYIGKAMCVVFVYVCVEDRVAKLCLEIL